LDEDEPKVKIRRQDEKHVSLVAFVKQRFGERTLTLGQKLIQITKKIL